MQPVRPDPAQPAPARPAPVAAVPAAKGLGLLPLAGLLIATALVTLGVTALLVNIFGRKMEARTPFVRLVEVDEATTDSQRWGINWPRQYDGYRRTADTARFYGGSSAMPAQKLDEHPWLRRLYAGYAFALDYREARGHAYMLSDQLATRRITERPQPGACLHCHSSVISTYRRVGLEALNQPADAAALAGDFNWPAVQKGFELLSTVPYPEAYEELARTPAHAGHAGPHPVGCVDCHDPETMQTRVTRPGFVRGIAALAAGPGEVPHLPSIEHWRKGDRAQPYNPNTDATRQEMRSFVCAQCHVEYYCGPKETLLFPWANGLRIEQIEAFYDEHRFPDGEAFHDYKHGETGAPVYKAQHPEFELWSQGIHARSGVGCADCHMPYERQGAMKVSSHWVRSPTYSLAASCQVCHNVPESELRDRIVTIQNRTRDLIERAALATTDMLDAIRDAQAVGATPEQLAPLFELQRKSHWRLDFISSENSLGFHADQETARILAESIDYARRAQAMAIALRASAAPASGRPVEPLQGVTPTESAPLGPTKGGEDSN
ncbi:MAG TPA: ammonia-forming cytochrome c nitrite reductase subunit c552 [Phycisphaerae bacterium]|nr:ammonia-forming cytochrome c nitrite reductase subunit c552 [Phycisphaerae bacterium]